MMPVNPHIEQHVSACRNPTIIASVVPAILSVPKSSKPTAATRAGRAKSSVADLIPPGKAASGKARPAERAPSRGLADQLARLGLAREQDLVLHLPLRYEDHTRLVPLAALRAGRDACRPKASSSTPTSSTGRGASSSACSRTATSAARARSSCCASSTFYPSQQKALAPGKRVRVFGDVRDGHFGLEIVHPQFKVVDAGAPLPDRLTPVYPTTAGLGAGDAAQGDRARARRRSRAAPPRRCPSELVARRKLWKFGDAVRFLHAPPPRLSRAHAAGARRAHASGVDAAQVRRAPRAAALAQGASQGARRAARAGADRHRRADAARCSRACRSS